jgi:hypothetical protein
MTTPPEALSAVVERDQAQEAVATLVKRERPDLLFRQVVGPTLNNLSGPELGKWMQEFMSGSRVFPGADSDPATTRILEAYQRAVANPERQIVQLGRVDSDKVTHLQRYQNKQWVEEGLPLADEGQLGNPLVRIPVSTIVEHEIPGKEDAQIDAHGLCLALWAHDTSSAPTRRNSNTGGRRDRTEIKILLPDGSLGLIQADKLSQIHLLHAAEDALIRQGGTLE